MVPIPTRGYLPPTYPRKRCRRGLPAKLRPPPGAALPTAVVPTPVAPPCRCRGHLRGALPRYAHSQAVLRACPGYSAVVGNTPAYVSPVLPAVDHLPSASVKTSLAVLLGAVPADIKADRRFLWIYVHLVRVTDKAIREYNAARDATRKAKSITFSSGPVPPAEVADKGHYVMLGADHLESCLDTTHRAVEAVALLRKKGIGASVKMPAPDAVKRLKGIRHAMQHALDRLIAEDLRKGRQAFGPGDPYGISPSEHQVTIGAEQPLTYVELVDLMESCYRAAEVIGGRRPPPELD